MRYLLKLEALGQCVLGLYLFSLLSYSWGLFAALFLAPDIGMLGYLINTKVGAWSYNLLHHKGLAIGVFLIGVYWAIDGLQFVGLLLFTHAAFDRMLGYGLKYERGFKFTHLDQ
ncbi:MAG: hypothetical protein CL867_01040 [Cytophagaceae bacterium]|nr:hypothetical protein [Cytophagaceae bacterium]